MLLQDAVADLAIFSTCPASLFFLISVCTSPCVSSSILGIYITFHLFCVLDSFLHAVAPVVQLFDIVLHLVEKVELLLLVVVAELRLSTESAASAGCSTAVEVGSGVTSVQVGVLGCGNGANVLSTSVCDRAGIGVGTSVGKPSVGVGETGVSSSTCYTSVCVLCQSSVGVLRSSGVLSCSSIDVLGRSSVGVVRGPIGG